MTTKEKILACYPHVTTESISKMVGTPRAYVNVVLAEKGLSHKYSKENGN